MDHVHTQIWKGGVRWKKSDFRHGFIRLRAQYLNFFNLQLSRGQIGFQDLFITGTEFKQPETDEKFFTKIAQVYIFACFIELC